MKGLYRDFFFFPDITVLIFAILCGFGTMLYLGMSSTMLFSFLGGMLFFVFIEYFTHRYFFHLKAPENRLFLKFLKRLHYDHHTDPANLKLLFLPVWYSLPNFFILSLIFYAIVGNMNDTLSFGVGLMAMLLIYEWKHYVAHKPIKPTTRLGRWAKKTHILHHYKNENYWYGVTSPLPDFLFGTFKDEKHVETSKTAKNLEHRS
ncbi:sterol desaturase family protein [Mesobacillus zeae]|uniref:Fatty acid hydroxylase family protein n=1 Tax=Mesobacillus zeae TaxID=1917180 RepID=A0A398BEL2_9BACI|nr:sterol desaturase family protein [Mesobacillus zeae]RID88779.1 fatty acid hydroxylase family protein [Mesobacillus zeae]